MGFRIDAAKCAFSHLSAAASAAFGIVLGGVCGNFAAADSVRAESLGAPAIAMHGAPALEEGFDHFPYVNPNAPKGGVLVLGERGAFDSLNPYLTRGSWPWSLREHTMESLMARSYDEPFTMYPLIAERLETPEDRSAVTFYLNPAARFSNGDPITADDVIFSFETLRDKGRPNYGRTYRQVARVERIGARAVRFVFEETNPELPLLLALMPVLSQASLEGRAFDAVTEEPLIGSGPYVLESFEMGRVVRMRRNPDYWGAELPVNRGRHNVDVIEARYFRDAGTLWEAFTAGEVHQFRESDPAKWAEGYDFPAVRSGEIVKSEIANGRPSGMRGFVFNTRREIFEDLRVRKALALALDYAWINDRFFRGQKSRIKSYFSGSELGFSDPIDPASRALLEPFAGQLPEGALDTGWRPASGAGDGRNRRNLRQARKLLEEAGWRVQDGVLRDAQGAPFRFEMLLNTAGEERLATAFADMLQPLGVEVVRRTVDSAQYVERLTNYDYDMVVRRWALSLSPGAEQRFYWGSYGRQTPGTRNYMGVADPVVDAMIEKVATAATREDLVAAARALDRALSSGVYIIPLGYLETDWVAHAAFLKRPARGALYGFWPDVWPDAWWIEQP